MWGEKDSSNDLVVGGLIPSTSPPTTMLPLTQCCPACCLPAPFVARSPFTKPISGRKRRPRTTMMGLALLVWASSDSTVNPSRVHNAVQVAIRVISSRRAGRTEAWLAADSTCRADAAARVKRRAPMMRSLMGSSRPAFQGSAGSSDRH